MSLTDYRVSKETGIFNQIAMFSISGLAFSMMLVIAYDFQIPSPWC